MFIKTCKNQHGFAIIYGLIVLVIATVVGTAILYMTRRSHTGASDYGKMRIASQAALSALKACEGQFMDDPQTAVDILNKYREDNQYQWLLGNADNSNTEQRIAMWEGDDAPEYSIRIIGFDDNTYYVKVEGFGYSTSNGKKSVIASYHLNGLTKITAPTPAGKYALYIANDAENFNCPAIINGDVYFGDKFRSQNAGGTVINGNLTTVASSEVSEIMCDWTINGNAYFRMPIKFSGSQSAINGKAGFEQYAYFVQSPSLVVDDDVYFNNTINTGGSETSAGTINVSGNKVTRNVAINESYISNASSVEDNGGQIDIASELGMCNEDIEPTTFDFSSIDKTVTYEEIFGGAWNSWTCQTLNNYYDNNSDKLWNGYLVIRADNQIGFWTQVTGTFTRKVIWIFNMTSSQMWENTIDLERWYTCSASSVTLICATGNTYINTMNWSGLFRGFIYTEQNAKIQYRFNNQQINGALIHTARYDQDYTFEVTGSGNLTITFGDEEQAMITELANLGIASEPSSACGGGGSGSTGSEGELIVTDMKIRPTLLGLQL